MKFAWTIHAQSTPQSEFNLTGNMMRAAGVTQRPDRFHWMQQEPSHPVVAQEAGSASGESRVLPETELKPPARLDDMRRSRRILWPIPIRVTGADYLGVSFIEDTVTVSINQQGARISLTHSLLHEDVILIMNPQTGIEEEFRVVRDCQQVFGKRQEWCVEAINPTSKIWGVDFNQSAEESRPMVLIECGACNNTAYISLTSTEYSILLSVGMISHHCKCCDQTTRWKPRAAAPLSDGIAVNASPVFSDSKRRKMRRLGMAMRVHVRNGNGIAEIVQTRDVSKGGLCFAGSQSFKVGDDIYITFPFSDNSNAGEVKGNVRWSSQGLAGRSYGVSYVEPN